MIRNSATLGDYRKVYNNMRKHPNKKQLLSIFDELKIIRRNFNLPSNIRESQ